MVSHFLFEAEFCNPASGWEKGQVEKNVRDGFVREYNAAIGLPAAGTGAATAGAGGTPEAAQAPDAWLRDSGLSQADILAHVADYGERCRNLEAQVNRLLDRNKEATDGHR